MSSKQRKFAAFDIDGTLFRSTLYREVFFKLMDRGFLPENTRQIVTPKIADWKARSHDDAFETFQMTLIDLLEEHLPALSVSAYEEAVSDVIKAKGDYVYAYTRDLTKRLKAEGYFLIAISGSQVELVEPFVKRYGFDAWVGQQFVRNGDHFTGEVIKSHTDKDKILAGLVEQYDLSTVDSYGVGDTTGDVGLLESVDNPIAFNPSTELRQVAIDNGWPIVVERKNCLYKLVADNGQYVLSQTDNGIF